MTAPLALAGAVSVAGTVALAACAAAALAWPSGAGRTLGRAGALVLAPALLLAELASSSALARLTGASGLLAATGALAVAVAGLALLAGVLVRHPDALPPLAVLALPFRIPIHAGGSTANLLVPLYVVIAAGTLAEIVPALRSLRSKRGAAAPSAGPAWLERLIAAFVVLYAVQAAYSSDATKALQQEVFFYAPFALLFVLLARRRWDARQLVRCLYALVALSVLFGALGLYEWTTKTLILNPRLLVSNDFHAYFRVNSFFFDPNVYGRFLAVVMLAVLAAMLYTARRRVLIAGAVLLAALWGSLLLTLSQSSLAALLFGLAVLAALRWSARRTLGAAGVLVVLVLLVAVLFPSALGVSLSSSRALNNATSGRVQLVQGGLRLFAARPLTGWGSASFAREYRRREGEHSGAQAVSASHTIPITVAAEQGVLGLALYLALVAAAVARVGRGAGRTAGRAAIAAAFLALLLHTLTYADFLEDPLTWALLGVGASLAGGGSERRPTEAVAPAGAAATPEPA